MDYKQFKKIKDEKDHAILLHPKGHEVKVAKKGLSKKLLSDLKNIPIHAADGADVQPDNTDAAQPVAPPEQQSVPSAGAGIANQNPQQDINQFVQQKKQDFLQDDQNYRNDLDAGQIKPETYGDLLGKRSTLGKISTIFGLMVGGVGGGLTHQPNAAMQMMDNEIQRDLDAQKSSAANRQNFLRINMERGLNNAQIQEIAQRNNYSKAQTQQLQLQNDQLINQLSAMGMRTSTAHHFNNLSNNTPPTSPAKSAIMATANQVNSGAQAANAQSAQQAAQAAGQLQQAATAASVPWYQQPGQYLTNLVKEKMGEPTESEKAEDSGPMPEIPDNQILPANTARMLMMAGLNGDKSPFASDMPEAKKEMDAARKAEKYLPIMEQRMDDAHKYAVAAGQEGHFARNMTPEAFAAMLGSAGAAIAGVPGATAGAAAGEGIGQAGKAFLTLSEPNKRYFSTLAQMHGELRAAFPEASNEEITNMVRANASDYNDSPRTTAQYKSTMKSTLKAKAQTPRIDYIREMMPNFQ